MNYNEFIEKYPKTEEILNSVLPEKPIKIEALKKGRTNCSFLVYGEKEKYVFRIPGAGADELVDRVSEAKAYSVLKEKNIADEVLYINPENGYKISKYYEKSRACDGFSEEDVRKLTAKLKELHSLNLKTDTQYDFFYYIEYYESLRKGKKSDFSDYDEHKQNILSLKAFLDDKKEPYCLIHNDMSPDNCLFVTDENGSETAKFIDWEYAAMQDPCADVAYFCTYCEYSEEQIDKIIDMYNVEKSDTLKAKIYCYIAINALVQSNWIEFKRTVGEEDAEENLRIYNLSKLYYKKAEKIVK